MLTVLTLYSVSKSPSQTDLQGKHKRGGGKHGGGLQLCDPEYCKYLYMEALHKRFIFIYKYKIYYINLYFMYIYIYYILYNIYVYVYILYVLYFLYYITVMYNMARYFKYLHGILSVFTWLMCNMGDSICIYMKYSNRYIYYEWAKWESLIYMYTINFSTLAC